MRRIFVAWCVNTKFRFQADYPVHAVTGCWTVGWKLRSQRCWNQRHRCHRSILIHSVIHAKLPLVLRGVRPVANNVGELRYLADLTAETFLHELPGANDWFSALWQRVRLWHVLAGNL